MASVWIFTAMFRNSFLTPAAPERQPIPRGRATVPRPPHTAALGASGVRRGAAVKVGERGASKVGLPGVANNRYQCVLIWVSGRALDFGGQKHGFKSSLSAVLLFFRFFRGVR